MKLMLAIMVSALTLADPASVTRVEVTEAGGVYSVTASFAVSESPESVMAVLSDYERIPSYVPDMEISRIVARSEAGMMVEQQAVSKFMMFAKRVHLLLDVREGAGTLRFTDRCGKSFSAYSGSWLVGRRDSLTVVDYQLRATPTFEVPTFVLKRLLKRDSAELIERIKVEITAHANRRK
jgi:hypothetical protein